VGTGVGERTRRVSVGTGVERWTRRISWGTIEFACHVGDGLSIYSFTRSHRRSEVVDEGDGLGSVGARVLGCLVELCRYNFERGSSLITGLVAAK
jgi:hypothetical protein